MEKRIEERLLHCLEVTYGDNDTFSPGRTQNISHHGMLIQAENQIFPIDVKVRVLLTIGNEPVSLEGVVCWNSDYMDREPLAEKKLGLFIPDPPSQYIEYVNRVN